MSSPTRGGPGFAASILRRMLASIPPRGRGHLVKYLYPILLPRHGFTDDSLGVAFEYRSGYSEACLYFGLYEANDAAGLKTVLGPGMTVMDIGANIGWYSALFLGCVGATGRVYCIEPDHANLQRLYRLRDLIAPATNLVIVPCVISDTEDMVCLYQNKYHAGHTIMKHITLNHPAFTGQSTMVQSTTLDALVANHGIETIDLLKIDVESAEILVLRGGTHAFSEGRVRSVFIEVTDRLDPAGGSNAHIVHDFMENAGFDGYVWRNNSLQPIDRKQLQGKQTNVFYFPPNHSPHPDLT